MGLAFLDDSYNCRLGDYIGTSSFIGGDRDKPRRLHACPSCKQDIPFIIRYEMKEFKKIKDTNGNIRYTPLKKNDERKNVILREVRIIDRTQRVDCEIPIKGKYHKNSDGEWEQATRYVVYHRECYLKELHNG